MLELADRHDLGSCAARRRGSSPLFPINQIFLFKGKNLKIETPPLDDHQVSLLVEIEADQMESAKHRAARKLSERKSVHGFRPGKAPFDVILRTFGEDTIKDEAMDILLDEIYPQALKESGVEPAAPGKLEKVDDLDKNPKFTFIVPLAPEVKLGDYRSIRFPYEWSEPDEKAVGKAIDDLRQGYAKTETVERPSAYGDFILVDVKGTEGKSDKEGEAPTINRSGFPIFLKDEENKDEWPFPGFSKNLVGLQSSEHVTFTHKFPKDFKDETLQGKNIHFNIEIKMVRKTILPELNDEFAKMVGNFPNVQALRDTLKANLSAELKADYDDEYYTKIIDKIKEGATILYAPQTVEHELDHVMEDIKSRLGRQNMDLKAYLKIREMDEEKFVDEEARPTAIKRLERSLIMEEVSRQEHLELDKEILNQSFQETWGELQSDQAFQKSMRGKSQPPKLLVNAVAQESAGRAYIRQTLERLKAIATGTAPDLPSDGEKENQEGKRSAPTGGKKKGSKSNKQKETKKEESK